MLDRNKMPKLNKRQEGFSLVELMIAIAIGLVITAAVTAMAVNSLKMNSDTLKSARLNQDLGAVMQIMVNDIRRAGYTAGTVSYTDGEDISIGDADGDPTPDEGDCVLYSYNRNANESIDDDERNGFKLDGGRMEMRVSCDGANCSTSCLDTVGDWVPLTDPDVISIKSLKFTTANSKCTSTDAEMSIRIEPDTPSIKFACDEKDNIEEWTGSGGWVDVTGSPLPLNTGVGVRQVNISLKGVFNDPFVETGSDYNEYPIKKSLGISIKVRN